MALIIAEEEKNNDGWRIQNGKKLDASSEKSYVTSAAVRKAKCGGRGFGGRGAGGGLPQQGS